MAENIETKYVLDISQVLDGMDKVIHMMEDHEAHLRKLAKIDPFREAVKSANNLEKELVEGVKNYAETEHAAKGLREELGRIAAEGVKVTKGQKEIAAAGRYSKLKSEIASYREELKKTNKELENTSKNSQETSTSLSRISKGFSGISTAVKAFLGLQVVQYIYSIGKSVFDTTSKFEKYEKILQTALGTQKLARQSMEALKGIAEETAFGMDELTEGYVKMVNRGLRPSTQEIIKLTDLAASQGKSFDQLVEAVLDAQTGEFERLKEFGIKAKKEAGEVSLAFKGQTESVKANERAIYDAIVAMGAMTGVAGQNSEMMTTLEGKTSNLGDSVEFSFNKAWQWVAAGIYRYSKWPQQWCFLPRRSCFFV